LSYIVVKKSSQGKNCIS